MHLLLDLNGVVELSVGINEKLLAFVERLGPERCAVLTSMSGFAIARLEEEADWTSRFVRLVSAQSYGLTKRDPMLYERVTADLGWSTEETVFVDDLEQNVEAARDAGLEAIRFDGDTDSLLERLATLLR